MRKGERGGGGCTDSQTGGIETETSSETIWRKEQDSSNDIYIYIILDLCDIAFLCQASPPKALIVQY